MATLLKLLQLQRDHAITLETAMYHAEQVNDFESIPYLSRLQRLLKASTEDDLMTSLFYAEDLAFQITEVHDQLTDEECVIHQQLLIPRRTTNHDLP